MKTPSGIKTPLNEQCASKLTALARCLKKQKWRNKSDEYLSLRFEFGGQNHLIFFDELGVLRHVGRFAFHPDSEDELQNDQKHENRPHEMIAGAEDLADDPTAKKVFQSMMSRCSVLFLL